MKNRRNFRLVLIGLVISLFGSAIQRFSFSLYLLDLTQDAAIFSNVMAVSVIPFLIFAPLAGVIADTWNKKKIMIVLDLSSFLVIGTYLLLNQHLGQEVLLTALVMFLLSTISAFYTPTVTAMIPMIVEEDGLVRANAYVSQVGSIANLAGPILAGLLYGIWGIKGITIINAVSFLGSAILEMFIIFREENEHTYASISLRSSFTEMKESYQYLKNEKLTVLHFIRSYCMYNVCIVPALTILLPYVIRTRLGVSSSAYGIMEGVIAAGMIAGAFLVSLRPQRFQVKRVYRWNYLMAVAILCMIGGVMSGGSTVIVLSWAISGFMIMLSLGIGNVVTLSYTQKIIDVSHLGKVSAFSTAVATISVPVGQIIFGWYIEKSSNIILLLLLIMIFNLMVTLYVKNAVKKIKY